VDVDARTEGDDARAGGPPRVLGRYRVVAELGRGSTSIVYLARVEGRSGFSKRFALKVLRRALAEDPASVALFVAEARLGAQLNHPNVVTTLEIEEGEDLPFIVMEYLDGAPLQDLLTRARIGFMPLPLHMHLAALSGAIEGLGYSHSAAGNDGIPLQVVHRDVSPHNVFMTISGVPKVLDFGFAQTVDSPLTTITSAGRVAYMSPEQASGDAVDSRSDLFSVGVMMWEAVTRRRFWSEEASKASILSALRSRELPPNRLGALAKTSDELRAMVAKATAPDPADRYATASAFQSDLRVVLNQITPPTFAPRDLGQRVSTLFANERARLQRAIEEDLQAPPLSVTPSPPVAAAAPIAAGTPIPSIAASEPPPSPTATPSEPLPSFPLSPIDPIAAIAPEPVGASRGRMVAVGLGSAALALGLGALLSALHSGRAGSVSEPSTTTSDERASAPSVAAPAIAVPLAAPPTTAVADVAPSAAPESPPHPRAASRIGVPRPVAQGPVPPPQRTSTPADGDQPPRTPATETPIHISDAHPTSGRPPQPIDSVNPYGP
jgi:serine/threonine protein kinase